MAEANPSSPPETRITVLISGSGTNLQALIDALPPTSTTSTTSADLDPNSQTSTRPSPGLPHARIVRVVSNRKAAFGLQRAARAAIPTAYHNLVACRKKVAEEGESSATAGGEGRRSAEEVERAARERFDEELARLVLADGPHLVVCAGWMHIVSSRFLQPLKEAGVDIINLHPALPGKYNGTNAIGRAHADFLAGATDRTGVMIHRVIPEVDMGEPILVREIPFDRELGDESLERFEQRLHEVEWGAIVEGTRMAAEAYWEKKTKSPSGGEER